MSDTYSLYEAKAKLSALVRQVREGARIVITVHGKPAAELRPYEEPAARTIDERIADLKARGIIVPASRPPADLAVLKPLARRPGALKRFLDERD
ncbi:MAG TPA: type II toxin-antitoxin system prevent-host-death family antitoxin [Gemmatimonadales bacterium]